MKSDNFEELQEKCLNKIAYKSAAEAKARAEVFQAMYGTKSYAYKCQICGCYHLSTHKAPEEDYWESEWE